MENRTGFNLNGSLEAWRAELAAQSELTSDARRELETHLLASVAELQLRGLNDEESFWLACRRLGRPQAIAREFAKNEPAGLWRERVFWISLGLGAMYLWYGLPVYLLDQLRIGLTRLFVNKLFLPEWVLFYLPFRFHWLVDNVFHNALFVGLFHFVPLICLMILFARGRLDRFASALRPLYRTRCRFLLTAGVVLALFYALPMFTLVQHMTGKVPGPDFPPKVFLVLRETSSASIATMLIVLIAWLMPASVPKAEPAED